MLGQHGGIVCPLGPGRFAFEAISVDLGRVGLRVGHSTPLLMQASVPQDMVCFVLALAGAQSMRLNGHEARPGSLTVYGAGANLMGANHAPATCAIITLNAADAGDVLPSGRARLGQRGTSATVLTDAAAWRRAASLVKAVNDVASSEPEVFDVEEARRALRASVLETLHELLDGPPGGERARLLRRSERRERVMRAADEYIRLNAGRVVSVSEVARALDVAAARLRAAVRATFGIGASRFLSMRRLLALRAAVAKRGHDLTTRRALATQHGFWQLPALESQYRALFHEPFMRAAGPNEAGRRVPKQPGQRIA